MRMIFCKISWSAESPHDWNSLMVFQYNAATADIDVNANTASPLSQKEMSRDAQRAIESLRTIASLMVTNPEFRQLGSEAILLTRDIFADAASAAADQAKQAAEASRPSEKEKSDGVDFEAMQKKGKATAKGLRSGKLQGEARENIWDEFEKAKQYIDEKLPEGDEARDKVVQRLQKASPPCWRS